MVKNNAKIHLNTSNLNKFEEFKRLFEKNNIILEATHKNLREISSDPITTVVHKASQLGTNIIVEDTSLDIEGEDVGIHVKWLIDNISQYTNKKAIWTVLIAYQNTDGLVYVYQGEVEGVIVKKQGNGFGFDPYFKPNNGSYTLAEFKPDHFNARAIAVSNFISQKHITCMPPIKEWQGKWQSDDEL